MSSLVAINDPSSTTITTTTTTTTTSPSPMSIPSSQLSLVTTGVHNVTHEIIPLTETSTSLIVPSHVLANKKKRRAIVLEEDQFTSTLDHIIRRDFFPTTSTAGNTTSQSSQSQSRSQSQSQSQSQPQTGSKHPRLHYSACDLSLGAFLASHTSEDNASYDDLAILAVERKRARMWWFGESQEQADKYRLVAGNQERAGNLDTWKYKTKNELMFYPEPLAITHKPTPTLSSKEQPSISYAATRFPGPLYETPITVTSTKTQTPTFDAGSNTPRVGGYSLVRTPSPAIRGDESPITTWGHVLGTPMHLTEEDVAALHVDDDGKHHASIPGFHVKPTPKRDQLAWNMTEKHKEKQRQSQAAAKRQALATASAGTSSPAIKNITPYQQKLYQAAALSPAAHRLLTCQLASSKRTPSSSSSSSHPLGDSLRAAYTPVRPPVPLFSRRTPNLHGPSPAPLTPSLATPQRTPTR